MSFSGTESIEKAMHKMENLIRHITTNCVKGFGYRWFDAFNRLGTGHKLWFCTKIYDNIIKLYKAIRSVLIFSKIRTFLFLSILFHRLQRIWQGCQQSTTGTTAQSHSSRPCLFPFLICLSSILKRYKLQGICSDL